MFALCRPKHQLSTPTPGNFGPKLPTPCWFEPRRHSIANCGRMVTDSATVTMNWRAYRKPPSLFRIVPSLIPYKLPFPQNGVLYAPKIREWPYLRNGWSDTLHVWLYGRVFRVGGANGAISGYSKIQFGGRPPSWIISNGHLRNGSFDPLIQRASHCHLCDSTAFLLLVSILSAAICCRLLA